MSARIDENRSRFFIPNAGRMRLVDGERASARLWLNATPDELEAIRRIAVEDGCTVSAVVRRQVQEAIGKGPIYTGKPLQELRDARNDLLAIGRNLNQVARALNVLAYPKGVAAPAGCADPETVEKCLLIMRGLIPAVAKTRDAFAQLVERSQGAA